MCAQELLTLGKNCKFQIQNLQNFGKTKPRIFIVPSPVSLPSSLASASGPGCIPNLDGNWSESSDSGAESDSENISVCSNRDLTEKDRVSKHISVPKSTVEGSCPVAVSKAHNSSKKCKKVKKTSSNKSLKASDEKLMEGEFPPHKNTLTKCSEAGHLSGASQTLSDANSIVSENKTSIYGSSQSKVCDNLAGVVRTMNVNPSLTTMAMSASSSTALTNVIAFPSNMSGGPPVAVSGLSSSGAGGQLVAVPGMNLAHPPVFVLSGGGAFPAQLSAPNQQGNLIVAGNFAGPMALIPGSVSGKPPFPGMPISLQNSGGVKVSLGQQPGMVALAPSQIGLGTAPPPPPTQPAQTSGKIQPTPPIKNRENSPIVIPDERTKEMRIEPKIQEDGTVLWPCNVCAKICPSESDLKIHKKRHKIDEALICPYCQRSYVDQHRYKVHVRFHTGETPFHCDICGKGFRDDRKMKLHMARHNSGLSHKCHLCPRSFEGPKALEKHLNAHATGRYVAPKVIQKSDGTTAMALPDDKNRDEPPVSTLTGSSIMPDHPVVEVMPPVQEIVEPVVMNAPSPVVLTPPDITRLPEGLSFDLKSEGSREDDSVSACSSMISLTMEDIHQYNVAQTEHRR